MYEEYKDVRTNIALSKESLLQINASTQQCQTFGLHENLVAMQALYNDKDLSFFANMGVLSVNYTIRVPV